MHEQVRSEIFQAFETVYNDNWFISGKQLQKFEQEYAQFNHVAYCIGVSNGLDALRLSLQALQVQKGDEVILPANTFIATALAVIHTGATPVFADIDEHTYNIDPAAMEAAITPKTKAIIPVHLYGQACNMTEIAAIAKKYSLYIVEDNAQAQGAMFEDKLTGSWGDINATSFYPGKNLGALGDAGGITTDSELLAKKVSILRNYGAEKKYHHSSIGYNMRMDECQAAFLSVKLKYLAQWTEKRREIALWYSERLQDIAGLTLPYTHPAARHVYHLFVIRLQNREQLQQYLAQKGIDSLIHYPIPLHLEKALNFLNYKAGTFPKSENHAATCLSLPVWVGMDQHDADLICTAIKQFFS
jgi:dTDP-4-amino-4,6-dideoxygalactose transaminase